MKFGKTYRERNLLQIKREERGKFLLVPRQLDTGRWAWLERVPYRISVDWAGCYTTYFDQQRTP